MSVKTMIVAFAALSINASEIYTVYLVRHADKVTTDAANKDPMLTRCGMQRAENLARLTLPIINEKEYDRLYQVTITPAGGHYSY